MKFTVAWLKRAIAELAEIWSASSGRDAVTLAADQIDRSLGINPAEAGESRTGNRRILIVPPLAIYYDVSTEDRTVRVIEVWRSRDEAAGDE